MKEIYFCIDRKSEDYFSETFIDSAYVCLFYNSAENSIRHGNTPIVTTSLAHLSYELMDEGYNIYLCSRDKKVKVEEGIDIYSVAKLDRHNFPVLLDVLLGGGFDRYFGKDEN